MSASEYQMKAQSWLSGQSEREINYEWEIQHHTQMHQSYASNLKG